MPCCDRDQGKCSGLLKGQRYWHWKYIQTWDFDQFRVAPVHLGSQDLVSQAKIVTTGQTILASPTAQARRDKDPIAQRYASDRAPHLFDHAGYITAGNVGQWHLVGRYPLPDPNVQVVERASSDSNQHFVRLDPWRLNFLVTKLLQPAMLMKDDRFHGALGYWPLTISYVLSV
jgi:hypothetical protein